jgi:hypothetical protein
MGNRETPGMKNVGEVKRQYVTSRHVTSRHVQFGTQKISSRLVFVGQSVLNKHKKIQYTLRFAKKCFVYLKKTFSTSSRLRYYGRYYPYAWSFHQTAQYHTPCNYSYFLFLTLGVVQHSQRTDIGRAAQPED